MALMMKHSFCLVWVFSQSYSAVKVACLVAMMENPGLVLEQLFCLLFVHQFFASVPRFAKLAYVHQDIDIVDQRHGFDSVTKMARKGNPGSDPVQVELFSFELHEEEVLLLLPPPPTPGEHLANWENLFLEKLQKHDQRQPNFYQKMKPICKGTSMLVPILPKIDTRCRLSITKNKNWKFEF